MTESWGGAGGGWGNPVVGSTALRIPAINSPNFNLANPAASPSPSWAILQSGLAYFFGLTLTGGTITGPDYIINTSGIFLYGGTPATGNLRGSWAPVAGTDAFGNAYLADIAIYGPSGSYINITSLGGVNPVVLLRPQGVTHVSVIPQVLSNAVNAGAVNEQEELFLSSGKAGGDDAVWQLFSQSADLTAQATAILEFGGTNIFIINKLITNINNQLSATAGTPANPTTVTTDTWHVLPGVSFLNGWVASGSGVNGIRYRLNTNLTVDIEWDIQNPGAVGTSQVFTLPAGYFNAGILRNVVAQWGNPGVASPWAFVNGSAFFIVSYTVANKEIFGQYTLPLT